MRAEVAAGAAASGWRGLGAAALAVFLAAGCADRPADRLGGPSAAPPPAHPAMLARAGAGGPSPQHARGHPLPPGHPTLPGAPPAEREGTGGAGAGREVEIDPLVLTAPEAWVRRTPSSGFVRAEFALARVEGDPEDARMTISTAGGAVDANIARWQAQFKENPPARTETTEVGGLRVVVVRLAGTLSGGGGPMVSAGPEKPNSRMWGAVVEMPGQEQKLFLKATGPAKTMERWEESCLSFLRTLRHVQ
jgi:hypothetical protein